MLIFGIATICIVLLLVCSEWVFSKYLPEDQLHVLPFRTIFFGGRDQDSDTFVRNTSTYTERVDNGDEVISSPLSQQLHPIPVPLLLPETTQTTLLHDALHAYPDGAYLGEYGQNPVHLPFGSTMIIRRTGGGKTVIMLRLMMQGIDRKQQIWYSNVKYMPVSVSPSGEREYDMRPIIARCDRVAVAVDNGATAAALVLQARAELEQRLIAAASGETSFRAFQLFIDEFKASVIDWKSRADYDAIIAALVQVIIKGRQVCMAVCLAAQDAQVQTLGLTEGDMVNFITKIAHPALDAASLRKVLPRDKSWRFGEPTSQHDWYVTIPVQGRDVSLTVRVPMLTESAITAWASRHEVKEHTMQDSSAGVFRPENRERHLEQIRAIRAEYPDASVNQIGRIMFNLPAGTGIGRRAQYIKELLNTMKASSVPETVPEETCQESDEETALECGGTVEHTDGTAEQRNSGTVEQLYLPGWEHL